jgi:hypothetical protein
MSMLPPSGRRAHRAQTPFERRVAPMRHAMESTWRGNGLPARWSTRPCRGIVEATDEGGRMAAGYIWDSPGARTERAVEKEGSLTVVVLLEVEASPNQDLAGGIIRFGLGSSTERLDADSAGGIVRFGFGSNEQ